MSADFMKQETEFGARRRGVEREASLHEPHGAGEITEARHPTNLFGDLRLGSRGNGPVRAAAIQQAQQTHGNRAVQRSLNASRSGPATSALGSAAVPIQREEEDPNKLDFSIKPNPEFSLEPGGGPVIHSGISTGGPYVNTYFQYISSLIKAKLGYGSDGNISAEAQHGPFGVGLEYNPSKKEGSAEVNYGDLWMKGSKDPKGYGVGVGIGQPLVQPPGAPSLINDPTQDLHNGDPSHVSPGINDIKEYEENLKKQYGIGAYFNLLPGKEWNVWLGGQASF